MTWEKFWQGAMWATVMLPVAWILGFEWNWRTVALLVACSVTDALLAKAPNNG